MHEKCVAQQFELFTAISAYLCDLLRSILLAITDNAEIAEKSSIGQWGNSRTDSVKARCSLPIPPGFPIPQSLFLSLFTPVRQPFVRTGRGHIRCLMLVTNWRGLPGVETDVWVLKKCTRDEEIKEKLNNENQRDSEKRVAEVL